MIQRNETRESRLASNEAIIVAFVGLLLDSLGFY